MQHPSVATPVEIPATSVAYYQSKGWYTVAGPGNRPTSDVPVFVSPDDPADVLTAAGVQFQHTAGGGLIIRTRDGDGNNVDLDVAAAFVGKNVVTINADDHDSLQVALNYGSGVIGSCRRVVAQGSYTITTTLTIPPNTILDGGGTGVITQSGTMGKMIVTANAAAALPVPIHSNTHIRNIALIGNGLGTEHAAGIHLIRAENSSISNVTIRDVRGDGITLGTYTGGQLTETCRNVVVSSCRITNAGRMGVALTNAEGCTVADNWIENLPGSDGLSGMGVDLEPNEVGDLIRYNTVRGNKISNSRGGIYGSSVGNIPANDGIGNHIEGNQIWGILDEGIKWSYSFARIVGNTISNVGKRGIWAVHGSQAEGFVIAENIIRDASQTTDNTYAAIQLEKIVHSIISGNMFHAAATNKVSKLWDEDVSCQYNTYTGNNGRQVAKAYTIRAGSVASHNVLNTSAAANNHEAFTATGQINASASTTGAPAIRIPHGSAPTTPTNGDVWTTTAGLFVRINGATVGPLT